MLVFPEDTIQSNNNPAQPDNPD